MTIIFPVFFVHLLNIPILYGVKETKETNLKNKSSICKNNSHFPKSKKRALKLKIGDIVM